ncbi:hypothetical protein [Amnibacterium setariae]|uniref:hypothetical protein n=1 Tax=Amnibacterium setariae TaxID=2306585 RepID=UPI001314C55B|nr:hypothetical protein [Amnibacterium setariae]
MSGLPTARRSRWTAAAIVGALVAVLVVVTVVGLLTAGRVAPASSRTSSAAAAAPSSVPTTSPTPGSTPTPTPTSTPAPSRTAAAVAPRPQPTRTAAITASAPVPIKKALSAEVVKTEAVQGTAEGPGEIAGPSVRFTIRLSNSTGRAVDLSSTVVNAYSGADGAPAVQLRSPGGRAFPTRVANGSSATGVFVFNIPSDERSKVEVTVDTAVGNPVIAFRGAVPRP